MTDDKLKENNKFNPNDNNNRLINDSTCEKESNQEFFCMLSKPARNALLHHEIDTLAKLATYTEKEILKLHGIGPASIPVLRKCLEENGLRFKEK